MPIVIKVNLIWVYYRIVHESNDSIAGKINARDFFTCIGMTLIYDEIDRITLVCFDAREYG